MSWAHSPRLISDVTACGDGVGSWQVITSKAVSKLGLGVPEQLASLWKGSLFSESEIQRIRQKRDSGITPDEKAQGLYWEMYQQRPAEAAAGFAEASADLASLFHQAGAHLAPQGPAHPSHPPTCSPASCTHRPPLCTHHSLGIVPTHR